VPEILAVPIVGGCQRYFDWMIGTLTRWHVQLCTNKP
jgi:hypothetical protein